MHVSYFRLTFRAKDPICFGEYATPKIRGGLLAHLSHFCPLVITRETGEQHQNSCPVCRFMGVKTFQKREMPRSYALFGDAPRFVEAGQTYHAYMVLSGSSHSPRITQDRKLASLLLWHLLGAENIKLGRNGGKNSSLGRIEAAAFFDFFSQEWVDYYTLEQGLRTTFQCFPVGIQREVPKRVALSMRLLTPLRLKSEGQILRNFDWGVFVRRLFGRLELLSRFWGDEKASFSKKRVLEQVARVQCVSRVRWKNGISVNHYDGHRTPLGGVIGDVHLFLPGSWADAVDLYSLLYWGQFLGVGGLTSKGEGVYRLSALPIADLSVADSGQD